MRLYIADDPILYDSDMSVRQEIVLIFGTAKARNATLADIFTMAKHSFRASYVWTWQGAVRAEVILLRTALLEYGVINQQISAYAVALS